MSLSSSTESTRSVLAPPPPYLLTLLGQGVTEQIRKKGDTVSGVLDFLIQYKIACNRRGEPTPILDRLVFKR